MVSEQIQQELKTLPQTIDQLDLIDRYSDQYGFRELVEFTEAVAKILDRVEPKIEDPKPRGLVQTARREIQLVLDDPQGFTDGLIVVVLMVGRSGLRQALTHFQELSAAQEPSAPADH